jgi:signal recognition particle subunit SRP19
MKDYDRYVVWLDYFDSELKREQGRRVPLSSATRAPKLTELEEACRRLNLQPTPQTAIFPPLPKISGYVSIKKVKPKQATLLKIARELSVVRGMEQKKQAQQSGHKK